METTRQKLIKEVRLMLGGGMVRVELTPEHYDLAVDFAMDTYRQRSSNSVDDRMAFLELQPAQTEYILDKNVIEVRNIHRRGTTGTVTGSGANFDPFGAAFANQFGMLSGSGNGAGGLLTFELASGLQETVGRMFGLYINFAWNPVGSRLTINRHIHSPETVLLTLYCVRSEDSLLSDPYGRPWLRRFAVAQCKVMLGEARGKFGSYVGPQGGTTLNGDAMKAEGLAEIDNLHAELANQLEQPMGYGFSIG